MIKAEVITKVNGLVQSDREEIMEIISVLLNTIINKVAEGDPVMINDFGTFYPKLRNKTTGRNIAKNTLIIIPPHYIPRLRPYQNFVNQVKTTNPV